MPTAPDEPNALYIHSFTEHLAETRAHLAGSSDEPFRCSYFPPTGWWTSEDKNRFFHALTIHSRLRPDLIAQEVGTKTLADVCQFIDELEDAAHALCEKDERAQADGLADDPECWEGRNCAPQAYEVSDEWVKKEEGMANVLAAGEHIWEAKGREAARKALVKQERARLKAESADSKAELAQFKADKETEWGKEDALTRLDGARLRVLDRILRDNEERTSLEQARKAVAAKLSPTAEENGASAQPAVEPAVVRDADPEVDHTENSGIPIDPELLALDARSTFQPSKPHQPSVQPSFPAFLPTPLPTPPPHPFLPPLSEAFAQTPPPQTSSRPQTPPPAVPNEPEDLDAAALAALSPTSRRRYTKRMYMRRKRAEATGADVVQTHVGRLKPGRKPKVVPLAPELANADAGPSTWKKRQRDEDDHADDEDAPEEEQREEEEEGRPKKKPKQSGLTKEYRLRRELDEYGYDAAALQEADLGMFHFGTLGKLMQLYKGLHYIPEDALTSISAASIQLLHDLLVPFVRDAVQRAIWVRKHQVSTRSHTKFWRLGRKNLILASQVHAALETMGCEKLDRRRHFATLLPRLGIPIPDDMDEVEDDPDSGAEADDERPSLPPRAPYVPPNPKIALGLNLLREVHTPAVRLPPRPYPPAPDAFELRLLQAYNKPIPVETLIESDNDAELEEIREEEELEKKDRIDAAVSEGALWAAWAEARPGTGLRGVDEEVNDEDGLEDGEEDERDPLRLVIPGKDSAGRVKSQVYVVDSD